MISPPGGFGASFFAPSAVVRYPKTMIRYKYLDTLVLIFVVVLLVSNLVAQKVCRLGPLTISGAELLFRVRPIAREERGAALLEVGLSIRTRHAARQDERRDDRVTMELSHGGIVTEERSPGSCQCGLNGIS